MLFSTPRSGFLTQLLLWSLPAILILAWFSLNVGPHGSVASPLLSGELTEEDSFVLYTLRLPRLMLAFGVGATLALSGLTYQSVFRNPLASPYTLGVSAGAALGVALVKGVLSAWVPNGLAWVFSLLGGGLVFIVLLPLLIGERKLVAEKVLLLGVVFSLFAGSLVFFLQYLMDSGGIVELTAWYFGSLSVVGATVPFVLLIVSLLLLVVLYRKASALDLLLLGDEYAFSHGVDGKRLLLMLIAVTTAAVALVVSVAGPIGFLGLIVPHVCRQLVGEAHNRLVPLAFLVGGGFLVACDLIARVIGGLTEVPVGLVTAIVGCPIIALLLLRSSRT